MRATWNRIRAFLRGPSDEELDQRLAAVRESLAAKRQRLDEMTAEFNAEREQFILDHPRQAWLYPPAIHPRGRDI